MYADDVQLYVSCPVSQINECVRVCNSELDMACKWAERYRLSLNPLKSKCIVIHNRSFNTDHLKKLSVNGQQLNYVDSASNLGFTIHSTLSWSNHVNCTIGKIYGILRQLNDTTNLKMLIAKTKLTPLLFYGVEVFGNSDATSQHKLLVAFNNVARYIFNRRGPDRISDATFKIFDKPLKVWIK